ncbi:hypothetical protein Poli38472_000182 [Pythium oligandrum]|uniref:EF-hand domain-containing protein n=1 Tax=Pythium oligandrum TaxID=41045 RepID=A0A8K1CC83_PYTOL|nr:hypothetical protein Poli38472_000182 [Pythium oligandrum]|eukprot:TMW60140.1 hypothetical protein Poli38472_000182 [Pythium oligandrum]
MPATEVSPSLRRRLSDDARQLLRSALGCPSRFEGDNFAKLSLAQRLQHFRGVIRLELPGVRSSVRLRIAVDETSYLIRYNLESIGAEVSVVNKNGATTAWITTADGTHMQLRAFVHSDTTPNDVRVQITTFVDLLEAVDLFDVFRACLTAREIRTSPTSVTSNPNRELHTSSTEKSSYVFVVDQVSGKPLSVTQTSMVNSPTQKAGSETMRLVVEDYIRYDGGVDVPVGIKSDVEIMIDTAMVCFSQWSVDGQQRAMHVFNLVDKDDDSFISSHDVYVQLLSVGHSQQQCANIVMEMSRLLCDTSDPAEEFGFYKFCGFWVTMLADQYRVSDPANESSVLQAFEGLFLGVE